MGNLRAARFDFDKVWTSRRANELRGSIRRKECFCPLANAAYSSMMCSPTLLTRMGWRMLKNRFWPVRPLPTVPRPA
jgi:hypothetical protein